MKLLSFLPNGHPLAGSAVMEDSQVQDVMRLVTLLVAFLPYVHNSHPVTGFGGMGGTQAQDI